MESMIALPNDYVVIDIETTGLKPRLEDILELSAIRVRDGQEVARYSKLIKPSRPIRPFIENLTGITNEMVENCPTIDAEIANFAAFIGRDILIGHNIAAFDTVFISYVFEAYLKMSLENSCVDTLRLSKKLYPEMGRYTLCNLSRRLGIPYLGAHRALSDCEITNSCYQAIRAEVLSQGSEEDFVQLFKKKHTKIQVDAIRPQTDISDNSHPLFQKVVVFTGTLCMPRAEAMQLAVNYGAILKTSVTKKTDFLVVGVQDIDRVGADGLSSKEEKAIALNTSGAANIQVISEDDFLLLVKKERVSV